MNDVNPGLRTSDVSSVPIEVAPLLTNLIFVYPLSGLISISAGLYALNGSLGLNTGIATS